ncbi:hypothetical protein [Bradyrhizobium phage BDU-MI-1]|nr:hypothetical protein [Bradyrhizobium phage BDU-MI-1]
MELRTTQDGILRAFGLLMKRASTPRQIKQKFVYQPFGSAIHAARHLKKHEAEAIDAIVDELKALDASVDENKSKVQGLLKELSKHPVKFVPVKAQRRVDYSKTYPYRSKKRGG